VNLPPSVREEVEARLGPIGALSGVGGGCINAALRLDLAGGRVFLKYSTRAPARMFAVEASGLDRLRAAAEDLRVPAVLAVRDADRDGTGWLALEWLEPARRSSPFGSRLGRGLAKMHAVRQTEWGWGEDGFIGSLPQPNDPSPGWAAFWWERRLEPQLARACAAGHQVGDPGEWQRLRSGLGEILAAGTEEGPSLLHGDLWGGNVLAAARTSGAGDGEPALVDPAAYHGHREVDLAMSELFGGFDRKFYAAYQETWPTVPGYAEVRRYVYQLYFLLVHVNLFGGAYVAQTSATLHRALAAA